MRSLKPLMILVGGSLLLSVAVALVAAAAQPPLRNARGVALGLAAGLAVGMFVFGPIAAADVFRPAFVRRHFEQLERWSAVGLAMGLGHLVGTILGDKGIILAFAFVFLGACFRVYLSGVAKRPAA